jgi:hypothetical protein
MKIISSNIKESEINLGLGKIVKVEVYDEHILKLTFGHDRPGMTPIRLSSDPALLINALLLFRRENPEYEEKDVITQGDDYYIMHVERKA